MDKMDGMTMNIEQANVEKLKDVFPEVFADGKVDFDKLQGLLGHYIADDKEKYSFSWKGKADSLRLAQKRSTGTLRPCKEESKNWDTTENLYIEGDNLEVLKLLQSSYLNSIKMIYIDPPYNTGNDFVYTDDFADGIAHYKEVTGQATKSNPETAGRYHTNWLNMMYPRLKLARSLLSDDGVIFISIDDHEQANLKKICDEIFGEDNFEGHIHWRRRPNQPNDKTKMIGVVAEHILAYARNSAYLKEKGVGKIDITGKFSNPDNDPLGDWASKPWKVGSDQNGSRYTITLPSGEEVEGEWMGEKNTYLELLNQGRIIFPRGGEGLPRKKYYKFEREEEGQCATNWWTSELFGHNQGANDRMTQLFGVKNIFSNPKPIELVRGLLQIANIKDGDIILDFFAGSATTADAILNFNAEMRMNCHFILVQFPENIQKEYEKANGDEKRTLEVAINFLKEQNKPLFLSEIGKERIRRAGEKIKQENKAGIESLDVGFKVLKLDSSNLVKWDNTPTTDEEEVKKRIQQSLFYLVEGREDLDLVYEIMLKYGLSLTLPVEERKFDGVTAYIINHPDYKVLICLQPNITLSAVEEMDKETIGTYIFADRCFADANILSNTEEILKKKDKEMRLF